jgi:hypothetical protein
MKSVRSASENTATVANPIPGVAITRQASAPHCDNNCQNHLIARRLVMIGV